jgi:hypothetical protein
MVPSNDDSEHRGRCSHAGAAVGELTAGDRIVVPRENNLEILVRVAILLIHRVFANFAGGVRSIELCLPWK